MNRSMRVTRRALLKGGAALGAGLVIGFRLPLDASAQQQTPGVFAPSQWLKIDRDGVVTITNSVPEMGQGAMTATPMIIADELDADWSKIKIEQAPAHPKLYANPVTGNQSYGGSRGVRDHLEMWRRRAPPRARCSSRRPRSSGTCPRAKSTRSRVSSFIARAAAD